MSFIKSGKRIYSKKYNKNILTIFAETATRQHHEPYYGQEAEDKCRTLSVSIPWSLDEFLQRHVKRTGISKSRYIRFLIEEDLNLEHVY